MDAPSLLALPLTTTRPPHCSVPPTPISGGPAATYWSLRFRCATLWRDCQRISSLCPVCVMPSFGGVAASCAATPRPLLCLEGHSQHRLAPPPGQRLGLLASTGFSWRTVTLSPAPPAGHAAAAGSRLRRCPTGPTLCRAAQVATDEAGAESGEGLLDLNGLKKEVARQQARAVKKVGNTSERLRKAQQKVDELLANEDADLDALESCPDTVSIEADLHAQQSRVRDLNDLSAALATIKKATDPAYPDVVSTAWLLDVGDKPPPRPARGPKKAKGKAPAPRKPYWVYTSADGVEIRVGRGAKDNDQLSCDPLHRDGPDWWLHVSGHPGSHVVIRTHEDEVPGETVLDAASLAAKFSKGPQAGKVGVSMVRCYQVSKPAGAKPGLVRLSGDVATVKVNVKSESSRLDRLENSKMPTDAN